MKKLHSFYLAIALVAGLASCSKDDSTSSSSVAMYPATVVTIDGYGTASATTHTDTYNYNSSNQVISLTSSAGGQSTGYTYNYEYNSAGFLTKKLYFVGNSTYTTNYVYDSNNKLLYFVETSTTYTVNTWDNNNKATSYSVNGGYATYTLNYNANGSLLNKIISYSSGNNTETTSYEYLNDNSKHSPYENIYQSQGPINSANTKFLPTKITRISSNTYTSDFTFEDYNTQGYPTSYTIKSGNSTSVTKVYTTYK